MTVFSDLQKRKPPAILYHYGGPDSVLGLVKDGIVWAGDIHYMNDSKEFSYALSILDELVAVKSQGLTAGPELDFLDVVTQVTAEAAQHSYYVYCLSEAGDVLSQWRGYTPSGSGYSIGFDSDFLKRVGKYHGFDLHLCIYEREDQERVVDEILVFHQAKFITERSATSASTSTAALVRKHAHEFRNAFLTRAPLMKHPGFAEEREWRLVGQVQWKLRTKRQGRLAVRKGTSTLVPYFELPLKIEDPLVVAGKTLLDVEPLSINSIIIGPTPHPQLAQKALSLLLHLHSLDKCVIHQSQIPYRTW